MEKVNLDKLPDAVKVQRRAERVVTEMHSLHDNLKVEQAQGTIQTQTLTAMGLLFTTVIEILARDVSILAQECQALARCKADA